LYTQNTQQMLGSCIDTAQCLLHPEMYLGVQYCNLYILLMIQGWQTTCGVIRQVISADFISHHNTRNHSPSHSTWILSSTSVRISRYHFGRTPHIP